MLSNDNGTQEQELSDERASTPLEPNDAIDIAKNIYAVKELVEIAQLLSDACEAIKSIVAQDGDINKERELLEQTEKLCNAFSLDQEYIQDLFYELIFGQPNDEPHDAYKKSKRPELEWNNQPADFGANNGFNNPPF